MPFHNGFSNTGEHMAVKTESKSINDREFYVTQWSAEKALLNKFKLIKMFGSSLSILASSFDQKTKINEVDVEAIGKAIHELFQNTEPTELLSVMKSCIVGVSEEGKRITEATFNQSFSADDLMTIYQLFIFVLQVNYSNFLKGQLGEKINQLTQGNQQ